MRKLKAGLHSRWVALPVILLAFMLGVAVPWVILAQSGDVGLDISAENLDTSDPGDSGSLGDELKVDAEGLGATDFESLTGDVQFNENIGTIFTSTMSSGVITLATTGTAPNFSVILDLTATPLTVEVTGSEAAKFTSGLDELDTEIRVK